MFAGVALVVVMLSIGRGGDPFDALLLLPQIARWAAPGAAYLAAGVGYGLLLSRLTRGARDPAALNIAVGVAVLAAISQIAGCLGLLASPLTAIGVLIPGWLGLIHFLWRRRKARVQITRPSLMTCLMLLPLAVLVAAASSPPGWLWDSEYGGFDVLSYHLQLPQEWLVAGRIEPQQHNVYSYLPGSFEAGALHIAAMTGAPRGVTPTLAGSAAAAGGASGTQGVGMLADGGWRLIACQYLHAWITVVAAWMVGRATRAAVMLASARHAATDQPEPIHDSPRARDAGRLAMALALATPWCVVVGSMAYNEMGVVLLGAAALVAALDLSLAPWKRGLLAGLLVGGACGFKPTAMTFIAPGVGLALVAITRPKHWIPLALACGLAGVAMLAPWMLRNWFAGGNPVFPFASHLFGSAHWTPEQLTRYASGHAFNGTLADRFRLLVAPDPAAGPTARDVERWRGMLNPQFGILFPAAVGGLLAALIRVFRSPHLAEPSVGADGLPQLAPRTLNNQSPSSAPFRPPQAWLSGVLLSAMLILALAAWLFTTHLQSRFLIPLVIPACALIGLALAAGPRDRDAQHVPAFSWRDLSPADRIRRVLAILLVLWQCNVLVVTFANQRDGGPNEATIVGPGAFSGEYALDPAESVASAIRRALPTGSRVYLLGDSGPLYLTPRVPAPASAIQSAQPTTNAAGVDLLWHTTWDTSPLGEAIRAGHTPQAFTSQLRTLGVTHVLINFAELSRYQRRNWYDPDASPERVAMWVDTLGRPIAAWESTRQALFALPTATTGGPDE